MWIWIAIAVLIGCGVYRVAGRYPRPTRPYRALLRAEAAFISSVAEAMFPAGGAIPESGLEAEIPGYIDRLIAASQPRIRILMHLLIFLVEHATLIFPAPGRGGMRRFTALQAEQQVAVLDAWSNSSLFLRRLAFVSLRSMLTMGYFNHPSVARRLGVAPLAIDTPICEADLLYPGIGATRDSIPYTPADVNAPIDVGVPLALGGPLHPAYVDDTA
jgi:hypothetical protein